MKKIILTIIAVAMVGALVACNTNTDGGDEATKDLTLYFANNEYLMAGNEDLEKLVEEDRTVDVEGNSLGMVIFDELKKGSENPDLTTVIKEEFKLHDVKIEDAIAYVDFDSQGLSGASMEEEFTINQIVASFLKLDEIDQVQFLVDGEKVESLMGHFDVSEPFAQIIE